ncbi:hypothetical protein MaudCBS49596_000161 [Microsporum audouinii]
MGGVKFHQYWIENLFHGYTLWSFDNQTAWCIREKLSERATLCRDRAGNTVAEGQAVYICQQVHGKSVGMEAIMKIRLQVPPEYPPNRDPEALKKLASNVPSFLTNGEVGALKHFNKAGCKVTPKLIDVIPALQPFNCPVPDGYIVFIVMEKVPGVPLSNFWKYDLAKREKIRAAFRLSMSELYSHRGNPTDPHLGNIIYDEEKNKCWIVDYEGIWVAKEIEQEEVTESDYIYWGLVHYNNLTEEVTY